MRGNAIILWTKKPSKKPIDFELKKQECSVSEKNLRSEKICKKGKKCGKRRVFRLQVTIPHLHPRSVLIPTANTFLGYITNPIYHETMSSASYSARTYPPLPASNTAFVSIDALASALRKLGITNVSASKLLDTVKEEAQSTWASNRSDRSEERRNALLQRKAPPVNL